MAGVTLRTLDDVAKTTKDLRIATDQGFHGRGCAKYWVMTKGLEDLIKGQASWGVSMQACEQIIPASLS